MRTQQRSSLRRLLAATVSGALVAAAAVVAVAAPANAVEAEVSSSELSWGVRESFRNYVANLVTTDGSITTDSNASQPGGGMNPFEWSAGTGSFDTETSSVDVAYTGSVHFEKHGGQLDITFANPRVVFDGTSGTLYLDAQSAAFGSNPAVNETGIAFASLSGGSLSTTDDTATFTEISATLTEAGAAAFAGFYEAGSALDPLTVVAPFTVPEPEATTTSLAITPENSATEGDDVALTATVSPEAAGTIEFFDGESSIGTSDLVGGSATLNSAAFAVGDHTFSAVFTPTDADAYAGSTSPSITYTVEAASDPVTADATSVSVSVSPETRVELGSEVTVSALVQNTVDAAVVPSGSVEFFETPAGGSDAASLGSAVLVDGVASLATDALAAGGHSFTAVYTPDGEGFTASESEPTDNYGVVDFATASACVPGMDAVVSDSTASASWAFSEYSYAGYFVWSKTATGDVSVSDSDFVFEDGVVTADAECATVSFEGSFRIEPHEGYWIDFADPLLSIGADGSGVWSADVTTSENATVQELVFATFEGVEGVGSGVSVDTSIALDYEGATALGTWNASYANAWPNEFVWNVPSAIAAYFYQTSTSSGNLQKPPSPVNVTFDWPAAPVEPDEPATVSGATLEWGLKQSFRSYVTGPIANGAISLSGVAHDASGAFVWSNGTGSYDASSDSGEVSYAGSVRFTGHGGLLDMTSSDPRIEVTSATEATLYLDVVSQGLDGSTVDEADVAFATLTLPEGVVDGEEITWTDAAAVLTAAGAEAFAGFYSEGTALDPVTFTFPLTDDAPTQPVLSLGASSVAQGGTLSVTGSGFEANENVTAMVHSDPVSLGTFTASAAGIVTITWTVPADFDAGAHTLVITRADDSTLSTAFTVTAAAADDDETSGSLAASDAAEVTETCVAQSVSGATISWGMKQSFVSYINGPIANGSISGSWGTGSGAYSTQTDSGRVTYSGAVHYTGHGGILDITLSNPVIQVNSATSATLYVTASGVGTIAFASLSLPASSTSDGVISWSDASATLTSAGAAVFSYNDSEFYPAGTALDPVSFSFPLGAEVECDSTTDGTLAATGGDAPVDAAWIAGILLALGAGMLVAMRRRRVAESMIRR